MQLQLFFVRKAKAIFLAFRLHTIFKPFRSLFLNLAYLSDLSAWIYKHRHVPYNDFFTWKWDYSRRYGLYDYLFETQKLNEPITYLEFGVASGDSFRWWAKKNNNPQSVFVGFDTFEGLPEDWGPFKQGHFGTGAHPPDMQGDTRASFETGLFQQTLPGFLAKFNPEQRKLIHMDADLYSSTLYVLSSMAPYLRAGDIVMFDEFLVPQHEFLAFMNFTQSYYLDFELLGAANNFFFAAFVYKGHSR